MKTCPYCGEQVPDEATACRYCGSALTGPAGSSAGRSPEPSLAPLPPPAPGPSPAPAWQPPAPAAPPRPEDEALQYSHSGQRYLLGYGIDFFGIWDRLQPGMPVRRYPRTDDGWREAWSMYASMEPYRAEVGMTSGRAPMPEVPSAEQAPRTMPVRKPVSAAWWLLPIFFSLVGGVVAWLVNREADPKTARWMLILGIVMSLLGLVAYRVWGPPFQGL